MSDELTDKHECINSEHLYGKINYRGESRERCVVCDGSGIYGLESCFGCHGTGGEKESEDST